MLACPAAEHLLHDVCEPGISRNASAVILNPGHPRTPNKSDCAHRIQLSRPALVQFKMISLSLSKRGDNCEDYVVIETKDRQTSSGFICGNSLGAWNMTADVFVVKFYYQTRGLGEGFILSYKGTRA